MGMCVMFVSRVAGALFSPLIGDVFGGLMAFVGTHLSAPAALTGVALILIAIAGIPVVGRLARSSSILALIPGEGASYTRMERCRLRASPQRSMSVAIACDAAGFVIGLGVPDRYGVTVRHLCSHRRRFRSKMNQSQSVEDEGTWRSGPHP